MFNTTHTLVGLGLARGGLNRWAPFATWTAVIAANLPDIDIVAQIGGTASYIEHHRGITHAIAGVPFLAAALATAMYFFARYRGAPHASFWRYFFVAIVAMATHPLLDWTNTYGIQPYIPFDTKWYYGDTLFIIDPYLDLLLLGSILISRQRPKAIWIGLLLGIGYFGMRLESREIARQSLSPYSSQPGVVNSAVQPDMLDPLEWSGFVATNAGASRFRINIRTGSTEIVSSLATAPPSPITAAALSTRTGRIFEQFARFPITQVEPMEAGYRVRLLDFRFHRISGTNSTALAAEVMLDRALLPVSESMSFAMSLPR